MRMNKKNVPPVDCRVGQINILDEIIVDNFAGGGGASTGIELAASRPVAIAINHDRDAILLHRTNHPYTEHLQASVWDVDPVAVCRGRPVGLAWFSPDCKHFSKAKGAALVDRNIRGLAWIVLRWAGTVRPRVIMLENVEEFQTWGPVRRGKPVKKKAGQTFRRWKQQLEDLGYQVEHRELVAADYGAPTTRKRFALIARCDGQPIVWPEPTHGPRDSEAVETGKLKPWRSAAEIIDWSIPGYSIFDSKEEIKKKHGVNAVRPLADNTLRRVIRGVDKFTIRSGKPFIVECNHSGDGHSRSVEDPVNTVTGKYTGGVVNPVMTPFTFGNTSGSSASSTEEPVRTITSAGNQVIASPVMTPFTFSNTGGSTGADAGNPVHTIRTAGGQILAASNLIQYHTEQSEKVRGQGMDDPIMTVDSSNRYALTCANLVEYYGNGNPMDVSEPLHTVTAHDREAVVCAHIDKYFGGGYSGCGNELDEPVTTVTVEPRHSLVAAHVVKYKGQELGQHPTDTLNTITAQGLEYADCRTVLVKANSRENLGNWPKIRELLNKHCCYDLKDDEILLLIIRGIAYFIADITLRMLTPRELYNAMGFPEDYVIDQDYQGNVYPKSKTVARCGNAVCPPLSYAMVWANFPEWHGKRLATMADLENAVAVAM